MQKLEQLILPLLLLSVFAIRAGSAIECYNCESTADSECSEITKTSPLKVVNCKPAVIGKGVGNWLKEITHIDFFGSEEDLSVPMVCQKIIALNAENKNVIFRGCQLDGGKTDVCETVKTKAKKLGHTIVDCQICREDACNKSPALQFLNLWLLIVPFVLIKSFI